VQVLGGRCEQQPRKGAKRCHRRGSHITPTPNTHAMLKANANGEEEGRSILTAINETVVVLRMGLLAVSLSVENDGGDAFGLSVRIIVEGDFLEGADGG
jgi:hypothetical protein